MTKSDKKYSQPYKIVKIDFFKFFLRKNFFSNKKDMNRIPNPLITKAHQLLRIRNNVYCYKNDTLREIFY